MKPAIDWNLSLKLASNNRKIAEELLDIYREVGMEKSKAMMDALLFGF